MTGIRQADTVKAEALYYNLGSSRVALPAIGRGQGAYVTRFQNEGYNRPKPFVRVLGKEMILWVLDSLNLGPGAPAWSSRPSP